MDHPSFWISITFEQDQKRWLIHVDTTWLGVLIFHFGKFWECLSSSHYIGITLALKAFETAHLGALKPANNSSNGKLRGAVVTNGRFQRWRQHLLRGTHHQWRGRGHRWWQPWRSITTPTTVNWHLATGCQQQFYAFVQSFWCRMWAGTQRNRCLALFGDSLLFVSHCFVRTYELCDGIWYDPNRTFAPRF